MTNRKNLLTNRIDTTDKKQYTPNRKHDNLVTKRMNRVTNVNEIPVQLEKN